MNVGARAAELLTSVRTARLSLAVAESCTGGALAAALTEAPGASGAFRGGVIAYADGLKRRLLGVDAETLVLHGAVSERTAERMAEGVREAALADVGVAITGIAGPGGGTPEKPVGTVWVAVASPAGTVAERHLFSGGRHEVREASAAAALRLALRRIPTST